MKYTKATARILNLAGSSYEIGYRLGKVISKDNVWRERCVSHHYTMNQNRFENINRLLDIWCPGLRDELRNCRCTSHGSQGIIFLSYDTSRTELFTNRGMLHCHKG